MNRKLSIVALLGLFPLTAFADAGDPMVDIYATAKAGATQQDSSDASSETMTTTSAGAGVDYHSDGQANGMHAKVEVQYMRQAPWAIPGKEGIEGELTIEQYLPVADGKKAAGGIVVGGQMIEANESFIRQGTPIGGLPMPFALGGFVEVKLPDATPDNKEDGPKLAVETTWVPLQTWRSRMDNSLSGTANWGNGHLGVMLDVPAKPGKKLRHRGEVDVDYLFLASAQDSETGETGSGHVVDAEAVYNLEFGNMTKKVRGLVGVNAGYAYDRLALEGGDGSSCTVEHHSPSVGLRAGVAF